jgi:hypothetical protein
MSKEQHVMESIRAFMSVGSVSKQIQAFKKWTAETVASGKMHPATAELMNCNAECLETLAPRYQVTPELAVAKSLTDLMQFGAGINVALNGVKDEEDGE